MRLDAIARELVSYDHDDKIIDFAAAGLYLPAVQTVFATSLSAVVSVLACSLIPVGAISAVRTLALTAAAGAVAVRRPLRVGNTKGIHTVFSALRPCSALYVLALTIEQLTNTCVSSEATYEHGFYRRVLYHAAMTVVTIAAFVRSRRPRNESDKSFFAAAVALLAVALLPPPALALSGPLCQPPALPAAAERVLRAFLFACVYTVLVYSAAPISNTLPDTLVCIARSGTASVWVLGATIYSLPLAAAQICLVLYSSFVQVALQYEGLAPADLESAERRAASPADVASEESDIVAAAAALTRNAPTMVQPLNGNGLSFHLALAGGVADERQRKQEAVAQAAANGAYD